MAGAGTAVRHHSAQRQPHRGLHQGRGGHGGHHRGREHHGVVDAELELHPDDDRGRDVVEVQPGLLDVLLALDPVDHDRDPALGDNGLPELEDLPEAEAGPTNSDSNEVNIADG